MDSLTQFTLGAAVGAAFLGPKIGARKAAVIGGLYGTLPDLDTFLAIEDPVRSFTSHRGATHSLIVQAVATPLFAEPLVRLFRDLRQQRALTYLAVYLVFATHALIDAMTVYGTQLFWPVWREPLGVGSVFIIDPLYTLPLLAVTLWAFCLNGWTAKYRRAVQGALAITTLYMVLTLPLQAWVTHRAEKLLAAQGVEPQRLLAIPTAMNTLFWRVIALQEDRYLNVYVPVLGGDDAVTVYAYPRNLGLAGCMSHAPQFATLADFTDGFYRLEEEAGQLIFADLRMGATPSYVFRFALAEQTPAGPALLDPPVRVRKPRSHDGDGDWLSAGIRGVATTRPVEKAFQVALASLDQVQSSEPGNQGADVCRSRMVPE